MCIYGSLLFYYYKLDLYFYIFKYFAYFSCLTKIYLLSTNSSSSSIGNSSKRIFYDLKNLHNRTEVFKQFFLKIRISSIFSLFLHLNIRLYVYYA